MTEVHRDFHQSLQETARKVQCGRVLGELEISRYKNVNKVSLDPLCGLVVRVPGYRIRGPCSIPGATRFSEK
jgi:hypothetical protein